MMDQYAFGRRAKDRERCGKATEYWATLSIYDHRTPNYRRALVLFDRVVIPVPTGPFRKLEGPELDQLSAEVDFLVAKVEP